VRGALLVPGENEVDAGIHKGVEQGNSGASRKAENVLHPLLLENVHHCLGAGALAVLGSLFHAYGPVPWDALFIKLLSNQ
jgi:hypothetical protein